MAAKAIKFGAASWIMGILGLLLILIAGAGTAGQSQDQLQHETWRSVFVGLGILLLFLGIIGWHLIKMFFEYKLLKKVVS